MFKFLILIALLAPLAYGITKFETCKHNGIGEVPLWVEFEGCEEAPCDIYEGNRVVVTAGAKAPRYF